MYWMRTVRSTPLAFMSERSVSGSASRAGTLAPWANGNAGSCFQTWTWGSMRRYLGWASAADMRAPVRRVRRESSDIDRLQLIHHVLRAVLVAGARTFPRDIQVGAEPAFEVDALQDAVAAGEID